MKHRIRIFHPMVVALTLLIGWVPPGVRADVVGFVVDSPGLPAATITIDAAEGSGEWTGAFNFDIDYLNGDPLTASVKALHQAGGIYLLLVVSDSSNNPNDTVRIHWDINHNHSGSVEASDWGIDIRRSGAAAWGPANTDPATWGNLPAANVSVASSAVGWTIELLVPAGAPSGLDFSTGAVGAHFSLFDAELAFDPNAAKYTQWPTPADLNTLLDTDPTGWGNYRFDPATTFPDLAVTGVRNGYDGPEHYYKISHTADNRFQVRVQNPGGTVVPDAAGVRLNLYIAARGLGEPFHRLDNGARIDADCAAPGLPSLVLPDSEVCSAGSSLPDISTRSLNDIVSHTALYTVKDGAGRLGGESAIIAAGTNDWMDILLWNTTALQDARFSQVTVGGTTYNRQHSCMKAEALCKNDPNVANNTRQVNMDFVCVPAMAASWFPITVGWAGFGKYDPTAGKLMYLQVKTHNMDPELGWKYHLRGVRPLPFKPDVYSVRLRGEASRSVQLGLLAPPEQALGVPLKRNLIIPPTAGGKHKHVTKPSGTPPIAVMVHEGSTIVVTNFGLREDDVQFVDLDRKRGPLPPCGPAGLPVRNRTPWPLGSLIGSFDNFRTRFLVAEGVQVVVPDGATHLTLGINDYDGAYSDNDGTGFRVSVIQRHHRSSDPAPAGGVVRADSPSLLDEAQQGKIKPVPLSEVMPTLCIKGYEAIGKKRHLGGTPHTLYRYVGEVCWGVLNVYDRELRDAKPDQGDPFPDN